MAHNNLGCVQYQILEAVVGGEHRCPCCRRVTRSQSTAVATTAGYTGVSMGCVFGPDFFEWVFDVLPHVEDSRAVHPTA